MPHPRSLMCGGRLDADSSGLLIWSQSGGMVAAMRRAGAQVVEKEYSVHARPASGRWGVHRWREAVGVLGAGGRRVAGAELRPAAVDLCGAAPGAAPEERRLRMVLHEGRHRQIRRMCAAVGLEVTRLTRIRIGGLTIAGLKPGQWRTFEPLELFGEATAQQFPMAALLGDH